MDTLYTHDGHVRGMLDRDQRTAKCPFSRHDDDDDDDAAKARTDCRKSSSSTAAARPGALNHRRFSPGGQASSSPRRRCRHRENGHFWKSLLRLKHALIVGVYVSLIVFPSTQTAPAKRAMDARMDDHPKWINPCGIRTDNGAVHDTTEIRQISDSELLTQIVNQANIAYSKAKQFKEDFVQKTFNTNSTKLHNLWQDSHYEWLPTTEQIPKSLGQPLPKEHLDTLKLEDALLDAYEYLQKIAVGLEQIVWDQHDEHGAFEAYFEEAEHNLRNLLCELQMTIYEHNIKMRPDVTRDIMTEEFRKMDNTSTNLRNWLIYRDYMNALEYVIELFNYLKTKL